MIVREIDNSSYSFLKECIQREIIGAHRKLTLGRIIRRSYRKPKNRFLFMWRVASYLYAKKNKLLKRIAAIINHKLMNIYGTEIALGARIDCGLYIAHHGGIVISRYVNAGKNLTLRQNITIGLSHGGEKIITLGDNVTIGAHCCIMSDGLRIGSNVTIGAMSFVNKDIPDNCTYYTEKSPVIIFKN